MKSVVVIVTKNGIKYKIGVEKSVTEVLNEIRGTQDDFYTICDNCAIRKDEIVSVEQFEYDPKGVENEDD